PHVRVRGVGVGRLTGQLGGGHDDVTGVGPCRPLPRQWLGVRALGGGLGQPPGHCVGLGRRVQRVPGAGLLGRAPGEGPAPRRGHCCRRDHPGDDQRSPSTRVHLVSYPAVSANCSASCGTITTYFWVSAYGGTPPYCSTAPGPAL